MQACQHSGIEVSAEDQGGMMETHILKPKCNNLLILAEVASEKLRILQFQAEPRMKRSTSIKNTSIKKKRFGPPKFQWHSTKKEQKYRKYIEQRISSMTNSCGPFTKRVEKLRNNVRESLRKWQSLPEQQKHHVYKNTKYIVNVINKQSSSDSSVKEVGTLPFMQVQGHSNHCGVCALNNLVGRKFFTVQAVNKAADDVWLRQFEHIGLNITDDIQDHRDVNGFHSLDSITEVAQLHGYHLQPLKPCIQSLCAEKSHENPIHILKELFKSYKQPLRLLLLDNKSQHYIAVQVYEHTIWQFDSLYQKRPSNLTADALLDMLNGNKYTTFSLMARADDYEEPEVIARQC